MKRKLLVLGVFGMLACQAQDIAQPEMTEVWEPVPPVVTPGATDDLPPSDAIVLFDGKNLNAWTKEDGSPAEWTIKDGIATVKPGSGNIQTKESFGSVQLHVEWSAPDVVEGEGQHRGNSGVFLQKRYEVQVLDMYNNKTYSNGQTGSLYKQAIPLANAMRKPNEWNSYDIIYDAPVFNEDGIKVKSAYITVIQNGILLQNHKEILGTTEYIGLPKNIAHGDDVIMLQDHSNLVQYRNIWLRKL